MGVQRKGEERIGKRRDNLNVSSYNIESTIGNVH